MKCVETAVLYLDKLVPRSKTLRKRGTRTKRVSKRGFLACSKYGKPHGFQDPRTEMKQDAEQRRERGSL